MNDEKQSRGQNSIPANQPGLYSAAKVRSGDYRDFTASRRETRTQFQRSLARNQVAMMQDSHGKQGSNLPTEEQTSCPGATHKLSPLEASPPNRGNESQINPQDTEPAFLAADSSYAVVNVDKGSVPHKEVAASPRPQWLDPVPEIPAGESLLDARERIASRWFALKGVLAPDESASAAQAAASMQELPVPSVAIFSIAGGVGKTSIAAGLGRALAAYGERVLLADTTNSGLLPFYFGSRDLKPETVRTFSPPEGSGHAPVYLLTLDAASRMVEGVEPDPLVEGIRGHGSEAQRILIDIQTADMAVALRLIPLASIILVPLLADMNSVVSLGSMESVFAHRHDANGRALQVFYLLNRFDPASPLHLDVREILQRQLGDRLLPFVIHVNPAVSEALAEGMTVMDYAPNATVTDDYLRLAGWLQGVSPAVAAVFRGPRWSER